MSMTSNSNDFGNHNLEMPHTIQAICWHNFCCLFFKFRWRRQKYNTYSSSSCAICTPFCDNCCCSHYAQETPKQEKQVILLYNLISLSYLGHFIYPHKRILTINAVKLWPVTSDKQVLYMRVDWKHIWGRVVILFLVDRSCVAAGVIVL